MHTDAGTGCGGRGGRSKPIQKNPNLLGHSFTQNLAHLSLLASNVESYGQSQSSVGALFGCAQADVAD
jgi:hypothetical protein